MKQRLRTALAAALVLGGATANAADIVLVQPGADGTRDAHR